MANGIVDAVVRETSVVGTPVGIVNAVLRETSAAQVATGTVDDVLREISISTVSGFSTGGCPEGTFATGDLPSPPIAVFPASSLDSPFLAWPVTRTLGFATPQMATFAGRESFAYQPRVPTWRFEVDLDVLRDQTQNQSLYVPYSGLTELQEILGFYQWCCGSAGAFYFDDYFDDSRTTLEIAVGDGFSTAFTVPRVARRAGGTTTLSGPASGTTLPVVSLFGFDIGDRVQVALTGGGFFEGQVESFQQSPPEIILTTALVGSASSGNAVNDMWIEPVGAINTNKATDVYLNGVLQSSGSYTISGNQITFDTAPGNGVVVTVSFWFYYLCHFMEDKLTPQEVAKNLWQIKKFRFESLPRQAY
jgi:hypothetical protein